MKRYPGPIKNSSELKIDYTPVACEFTDDLEHLSVLNSNVEIRFFDVDLAEKKVIGLIVDVFTTSQKEEFLKMNNQTLIRLDRIIEIREIGK